MIDAKRRGHHRFARTAAGRLIERPDAEAMAVVQRTAAAVADRPVALAEKFYEHLFELAPAVRTMFPPDMTAQNDKLCRALFQCVGALVSSDEEMVRTVSALRRLGAHHEQHHAVRPEHYPYVGHALVRAVRDLSQEWSTSASSSWVWVYEWMTAHMLGRQA
ncbi:globin domain-containing protein [Actinoplanes sp. RD1]|uniref:globin domain-containing protein n=1 Tax=Actinoplanes sp. RD1 TaxID=3064538 RepID=UPI0027406891|nr:globin domain-containing protein [Actinoplanes sp. RD1]